MNLTRIYDFLHVLHIKMSYSTKDHYFSTHILFTTIYLLQQQTLTHNHYSEQNINMRYFIQAIEHDVHMYAKI
jgi:hypothetical protein